jgi:hypothetical protein
MNSSWTRTTATVGLLFSLGLLAACGAAITPTATPVPTPASAEQVPRITPQELQALMDSGKGVIVLDTRSREAYDEKHIAGALSMPSIDMDTRYTELPRDKELVLY